MADPMDKTSKTNKAPQTSNQSKLVIILAVVIVILIALFAWTNKSNIGSLFSKKDNSYRAIFLTNGQVYFGQTKGEREGYVDLTKVFYLQVQQPLQGSDANKDNPTQPSLKLVKLGTELHGPTDDMKISKQQILFTETLKNDSEVVKGINDYYTKNK